MHLRASHLVKTEREGTSIRYSLSDDKVADFFRSLRVLAITHLAELDRIVQEYFNDWNRTFNKEVGFNNLKKWMDKPHMLVGTPVFQNYYKRDFNNFVDYGIQKIINEVGSMSLSPETEETKFKFILDIPPLKSRIPSPKVIGITDIIYSSIKSFSIRSFTI